MLIHIAKVLTTDQVAACRTALGRAKWLDGRVSAGSMAAPAKHNDEADLTDSGVRQWSDTVRQALSTNQSFVASALPAKICPPSFNRYSGGQNYGSHNDAALFEFAGPDGANWLRSDLAATLFLSEIDEYDGGELIIEDDFGLRKVKFPAGDIVVYPASSQHRVEPVTRGTRLASYMWIQSLVRDDQHRRLLRDLDGCVMQLNRDSPNSATARQLLGLYHNLLRLWSDT